MRSLLSFLALLWVTAVSAISTTGDRLLVVLDDVADKATYSKFLGDLESACKPSCCFFQFAPWLIIN